MSKIRTGNKASWSSDVKYSFLASLVEWVYQKWIQFIYMVTTIKNSSRTYIFANFRNKSVINPSETRTLLEINVQEAALTCSQHIIILVSYEKSRAKLVKPHSFDSAEDSVIIPCKVKIFRKTRQVFTLKNTPKHETKTNSKQKKTKTNATQC